MEWFHDMIGTAASDLTVQQMTIRAILVFLYGLVLLRVAGRRVLRRGAPLDFVLAVLIGSNLSRTLTGNAPFLPTLAATTALFALYWLFAFIAMYWSAADWLLKGKPVQLIDDGHMLPRAMRDHALTESDLEEALRSSGTSEVAGVRSAFLERSGDISVQRGE